MLYELSVSMFPYNNIKSELRVLEVEKETPKTYVIKGRSVSFRNTIRKEEMNKVYEGSFNDYLVWFTDLATLEDHRATLICKLNQDINILEQKIKSKCEAKRMLLKVKEVGSECVTPIQK